MKFYSIIIKYRLYIGIVLIAVGIFTNIYSSFWPAANSIYDARTPLRAGNARL